MSSLHMKYIKQATDKMQNKPETGTAYITSYLNVVQYRAST